MKPGKDFIGVGVGAVIKNSDGKILLMKRGALSKSEPNTWCIPGGAVEFGEKMESAVIREIKEELNIDIEILKQYGCADYIMLSENQHWVSGIFLCKIVEGEPKIMEPGKCDEIGWYNLEDLGSLPLGVIMKENIKLIKLYE